MLRELCVLLVIGVTAQALETIFTYYGRQEGEECYRRGDDVWTCKKDSECEVHEDVLRIQGILKICSWIGQYPVLCCPPTNKWIKKPERIKMTKSEEKCVEYSHSLCYNRDAFPFLSLLLPAGYLQRGKRQTSDRPDQRERKDRPNFIVGGRLTQTGEFPSMALIGSGNFDSIRWHCGGSLISENFVLSAAHCVYTDHGMARWVRLGDLNYNTALDDAQTQQLEIIDRVVHPGYRPPEIYNDIVLFRLNCFVAFNRFVKPACLHTNTRDPTGFGTAAGWGKEEFSGPMSPALMQVDISFVPARECRRLIGWKWRNLPNGVNPQTMVCAGGLGRDTCKGDSGGPLILPATPWATQDCLARVVGVTSFGLLYCGATSLPAVYGRVAHFRPWIESVVWPK